jgi:hypothetical protein
VGLRDNSFFSLSFTGLPVSGKTVVGSTATICCSTAVLAAGGAMAPDKNKGMKKANKNKYFIDRILYKFIILLSVRGW